MRKFTPDTLVKPPWMKRVIQTNPEIGKMLGNVPAVVAKSFDMFFYDLMAELTAEATGGSQITPSLIKSFVDKHDKYKFLGEVVNDTVEMIQANRRGVKKASQRSTPNRSRSKKPGLDEDENGADPDQESLTSP